MIIGFVAQLVGGFAFEAARRLIETDELKPKPRKSLTELVRNFERWRSLLDGLAHTELAETVLGETQQPS